MRRRSVILGLGGAVASTGGTLALGAWRSRNEPNPLRPLPLPAMGWELTDHRGQRVSPADWAGRPVMAFFGFTWCPDICPTTLLDISDWLEELGSEADRLIVALITVDPERDTPEVLAGYVENFHPRITGLTGSASDIARAAEDFRVKYWKVPNGEGDYSMNHTSGVFLFAADGRLVGTVDFHEDRRYALPKIRRALAR